MIQDHTIDQALVELARTMKALKALRAYRKDPKQKDNIRFFREPHGRLQATAERAALDCRYKLADLRLGR